MLDYVVTHDKADVTLCSYMLKAVAVGAQTIRILSDDTGVFVLLDQGCALSPRFKWKSGMAISWTSTKLFSG